MRQSIESRSRSRMAIFYRPVLALKPDPKNPRVHTDKQLRQIATSIETFGFNVPILINSGDQIIAGHGRAQACKLLGIEEVPTIRLEHLTEVQAKAFLIADNRLTEIASWDDQLLGEQLKILSELDLDFSLEATGFEMAEIDTFIEGLSPAAEDEDHADVLPESNRLPVTKLGDLWLLGKHRVLCGSALESESYGALMASDEADVIFTDPPYNVRINGNVAGHGATQYSEFQMAAGEMSQAEFTDFLTKACTLLTEYSGEGSIHYVCMDWRHMKELLVAGDRAYTEFKNLCVWAKNNGGLGSLYRSQHELVFVFKSGKGAHVNNIQMGQHGRYRTNVWQYPGVNSFSKSSSEGNLLELHPTVKPVAMVADALMDCSKRGDIVLDAFLGSGTTVIAAERTGRICYGLEIDPRYVDTIVHRWEAFTGLLARHAVSERSFRELEQEAANVAQQ